MSTAFIYEEDVDLQVHKEQALKFICKAFASHENGLPEWVKNASDEYCREPQTPAEGRVIVLLFRNGKGKTPARIGCLDFSGMTSSVINKYFRKWVDPEAAKRGKGAGIQGGHGNGGKCYMSHMFEDHSFIETLKDSKGNRYGVPGGQHKFGYIPDKESGCDFKVLDPIKHLDAVLEPFGIDHSALPTTAVDALKKSGGFTLVCGVGPKDYANKLPVAQIVNSLRQHTQMVQSLELCSVYVVANGDLYNNGAPLAMPQIEPREKFENPRRIEIPKKLKDPLHNTSVDTTEAEPGHLLLYTSAKSMRYKLKNRHAVIYSTNDGYIGYKEVDQFDISSAYRQYIYGECFLPKLDEYKSNDRAQLSNSPLTRAVDAFISKNIESLASEFEAQDKKKYGKEEKNAVSKMNDFLNRWKNKFLNEYMKGLGGPGSQQGTSTPEGLPTGRAHRIELDAAYSRAGIGVTFRPRLRFYDKDNRQIRPVQHHWVSDNTNVAMVNEDLNVIDTYSVGQTFIYAETEDGKLRSDKHPLEVVNISHIVIAPSEIEVPIGGRSRLTALCTLDDGSEVADVCLTWTENNTNIARVSTTGTVFGSELGTTEVIAGDDKCQSDSPVLVTVVEATKSGGKGKGGLGYPRILVSGEFDRDPDTGEFRTFSKDEPPVLQYPEDYERNIFWINSASPLATLYLSKPDGYGYHTREWRMYHVERFVEIIIQIAIRIDDEIPDQLTLAEWSQNYGYKAAQIQSEIVDSLAAFINDGTEVEV